MFRTKHPRNPSNRSRPTPPATTTGSSGQRATSNSRLYSMTNNPSERLVWLDCEMTGLDLERDELVEIACVVTEADLTILDEGVSFVIRPSATAMSHMPDVVQEMHTASGLLPEIPDGITVQEAQSKVLAYVKSHISTSRKAPLCGSSIYVDRGFLAKYMPDL